MKQIGVTLLTCVGVAAAIAISPTAASAADQGDINACDGSCQDWNYVESAGNLYDGATLTVGDDVVSCSFLLTKQAVSTKPVTIGHTWSWTHGAAGSKFMEVIGRSVSDKYYLAVHESITSIDDYALWVPDGQIGHLTFTPQMYHSEGTMRWNEYMFDEFNTTNELESAVTSETPVATDGKGYNLESRTLTKTEFDEHCT